METEKLEMTQMREKVEFFAQYWNQDVFASRQWLPYEQEEGARVSYHSISQADSMYSFLLLKPLSAISDEDAIELTYILDPNSVIDLNSNEVLKGLHVRIIKDMLSSDKSFHRVFPIIAHGIDFLRSKSYALPFRQYTVEQMIELGWIKLNHQPQK